jgi:hypothetical protein
LEIERRRESQEIFRAMQNLKGGDPVMGRKGENWYFKQTRDMKLNCWGGVKEEKLRFVQIEGGARGFTEIIENIPEFVGFLSCGRVQEHGVIHKLVVGGSQL